jgi:hypothetical protein
MAREPRTLRVCGSFSRKGRSRTKSVQWGDSSTDLGPLMHIKLPKRKSVEAVMCEVRCKPAVNPGSGNGWAGLLRERCVWCLPGRATSEGARGLSVRVASCGHPGAPRHNRVSGIFSSKTRETSCNREQKTAEVSGKSVGSRRRERLIREKIIGHRMRAGLMAGRGGIVSATRGRTLALLHQPAREHREPRLARWRHKD